jgi:hypothetical protein
MNTSSAIRLLAPGNNERGDLFTRLTKDLFFALGYDNLRLDVHKSGRELDIQGEHRFEVRRVVGECKAHAAKIGGDELNKFFGVLSRERKKHAPLPVAGYFVSLAGFTETGIEQETETGDEGSILLDAHQVIQELERCRVIVGRTDAAERAGRCAQHVGLRDAVLDGAELLGHQRGYVWALFYARSKERTHFILIHADGTPLAESVAQEIIEADGLCGGVLHSLQYLTPPVQAADRISLAAKTDASYRKWIGEECGYIQLDGLPADTDLSATRLKLERLFVPLKATFLSKPDDLPEVKQKLSETVLSIGEVLERANHLALLAVPGGGKSTLLKRLATAYAFPARRGEVTDHLPEREWLPLFLRCRELRDRAHRPIIELLDDIPRHAGMNAIECATFQESVHANLRSGSALLLVDGLDEISDEGARQTFANHLRTFLAMFPQVALVVTSREAGFRLVAGVVASACEQAKLAPLDEADVLSLCERWHVEVIGESDKVRAEAKELGKAIWSNERIRKLAETPLLLTTLLVVKRWIGELPRSRAALYREAIRVLVRTWNVEGFAPLDEDETLAQLSYVACSMMENGKQQIGQKPLLNLLQNGRQELEAELQFARISPQEFIRRIEYRSSLLMQTGHERIEGMLEPVYEFRHLTFQEYLAARGYVEEQYPARNSGQTLAEVLERHFEDEHWQEVIPLAAVLAGRRAEDLIKRLTVACGSYNPKETSGLMRPQDLLGRLLYQCIMDEVQITAPTLRTAILELARERPDRGRHVDSKWVSGILRGKFGEIFYQVVHQEYVGGGSEFEKYSSAMAWLALFSTGCDEDQRMSDALATSLQAVLNEGDRANKIRAALVCTIVAYNYARIGLRETTAVVRTQFQSLADPLIRMLSINDLPLTLASSWALAWIGSSRLLTNPPESETLLCLYRIWRQLADNAQARFPAWALWTQQLLSRDSFESNAWGDCDLFLRHKLEASEDDNVLSALVVGWYRCAPWNDLELVEQLSKLLAKHSSYSKKSRELLENLGEPGRHALDEWDRQEAERRAAESNGA